MSAELARSGAVSLCALTGPPGMGKTTLARHFLSSLGDFAVVETSCERLEQNLPYSTLNRLLPPNVAHSLTDTTPPHEAAAAVMGVVDALQSNGPVAVFLDDYQWVDRGTAAVLPFVLRRSPVGSLLIILAMRSTGYELGTDAGALARASRHVTRIPVRGLTSPDIDDLIRGLGAVASPVRIDWLRDRTGGHPLYLQTILDSGDPDRLRRTLTTATLPASLLAAVREQFGELPDDSRTFLDCLAVLDDNSPLNLVAHLSGLPDPGAALRVAVNAGLVESELTGDTRRVVRFRHPLFQEAIYSGLEPARCRQLHRSAARIVERTAAWRHRVRGSEGIDTGLGDELEREADEMVLHGHGDRAAAYLRWSAEHSIDTDRREDRLLMGIALSLSQQRHKGAYALESEAGRCAPSPLRSLVLGRFALMRGELTASEKHLTESLNSPHPRKPLVDGMSLHALAMLASWQGNGTVSSLVADSVAHRPAPEVREMARYCTAIAASYDEGPTAALRLLNEGESTAPSRVRQLGHRGPFLTWRGMWEVLTGHVDEGLRHLSAAVELIPTSYLTVHTESAYIFTAVGRHLRGEWAQAQIDAERAMAVCLSDEKSWGYALASAVGALVPATMGLWDEAERRIDETQRLVPDTRSSAAHFYPELARVVLAHAQGAFPAALKAVESINNDPATWGKARLFRLLWQPPQVDALIELGRLDEARAALDELLAALGPTSPYTDVLEAWLSGKLSEAAGDDRTALDVYARPGAKMTDQASPLHTGMLDFCHGRLLLRLGRVEEGSELLRGAHRRFDTMGSAPMASRCEQSLSGRGQPSRRSSPTIEVSLTEREREVAYLIGKGLTNNEIAQELFLSAKTIEYHLGHVFDKLGVSNRRQLRDLIADRHAPALTVFPQRRRGA